jgi:hypothetical protein
MKKLAYCNKNKIKKQGVCHTMALPFTLKKNYLKAKEELWKLEYLFHRAKT